MTDAEFAQAYFDGFCGPVCPFPRLDVLRQNILQLGYEDLQEMRHLLAQEREYYERRREAQQEWLAEWKRRNGRGPEPVTKGG